MYGCATIIISGVMCVSRALGTGWRVICCVGTAIIIDPQGHERARAISERAECGGAVTESVLTVSSPDIAAVSAAGMLCPVVVIVALALLLLLSLR